RKEGLKTATIEKVSFQARSQANARSIPHLRHGPVKQEVLMATVDLALEDRPGLRNRLYNFIAILGDWSAFSGRTLGWCFWRRPDRGTLAHSIYFVGVKTAPVVIVT